MRDTLTAVGDIIGVVLVDYDEPNRDDILDELGIDSIDTVDIMMELEEEFDLIMDQEKFRDCRTVGDLVDYIDWLRNA